jgi:hypothetical protein
MTNKTTDVTITEMRGDELRKPAAKAKKAPKAKAKKAAPKAKAKAAKPAKREARTGTKQAKVIAMLQGAKGATYAEIAKAMEWLPHTTRAMVSVALEKKLGLKITRDQDDKRGMVMRIK